MFTFSKIIYYVIQVEHSSHQNLWTVVTDEKLHAFYWLHKVCLVLANPLTTHFFCHIIDGDQDAMSLIKIIHIHSVIYPSSIYFFYFLCQTFLILNFNNISQQFSIQSNYLELF